MFKSKEKKYSDRIYKTISIEIHESDSYSDDEEKSFTNENIFKNYDSLKKFILCRNNPLIFPLISRTEFNHFHEYLKGKKLTITLNKDGFRRLNLFSCLNDDVFIKSIRS